MLSAKPLGLFLLYSVTLCSANKYSEDFNRKLSDLTEPFRILKVNLLWQKGKQNLPEKKLADLYADLQLQDKREGDLKKLKATGMDEDGLKAAQVEQKFINIVLKYGLNAHYKYEVKEDLSSQSEDKKLPQEELKDPKLKDLWGKATASGFTDDELRTLKQELSHHQMKLDEYDTLRYEFNRYKDLETNDIDSVHFDVLEAQRKNINLKSKHRDLKESMQRLEDLTSEQDGHGLEFSDLRVYQLWALAKKSNMSDTELDSLQEELRHFEHRLKKHEYFQEQLSLSQKSLAREVKDGDYPEHHQHLEKKVKEYDHKVKKIHTHLKTRIDEALRKHTEL